MNSRVMEKGNIRRRQVSVLAGVDILLEGEEHHSHLEVVAQRQRVWKQAVIG